MAFILAYDVVVPLLILWIDRLSVGLRTRRLLVPRLTDQTRLSSIRECTPQIPP
ncbi:hypothetical protein FOXYSP1_08258 [Fusarium oxysporum f. sp. phaseoli]